MDSLNTTAQALEQVKREAPNGEDYWMARDIQTILGYGKWDNFEGVIERSKMACESARLSGYLSLSRYQEDDKRGKGSKAGEGGLLSHSGMHAI